MKGICFKCKKPAKITNLTFNLCEQCSNLKQYRPKEKTKKHLKYRSCKRAKQERQYLKERKIFLTGQKCFIDGCNRIANTIEHTKGRVGDLLLDKRYWQPCCLEHNLELESNPELAKKYKIKRNSN